MINLRRKILLFLAMGLSIAQINWKNDSKLALQRNSKQSLSSYINSISSSSNFYTHTQGICRQLGQNHKKVYAFLTHNFHIGICSQGEKFYYYRQSKSNPQKGIILQATTVLGGNVFKAKNGKVTYFVGINPNGYYSSVMQPNHEILVEAEVKPEEEFDVKIEEPLDRPIEDITSHTELANFFCNAEDSQIYSEIGDDLLLHMETNIEEKDAFLYSYSCQ